MEIDIEKQKAELEKEIATLTAQLQKVDDEIARFQQTRNNQVALILKRQGFLEGLQGLERA